jgi:hypothetical protein
VGSAGGAADGAALVELAALVGGAGELAAVGGAVALAVAPADGAVGLDVSLAGPGAPAGAVGGAADDPGPAAGVDGGGAAGAGGLEGVGDADGGAGGGAAEGGGAAGGGASGGAGAEGGAPGGGAADGGAAGCAAAVVTPSVKPTPRDSAATPWRKAAR